MIDVIANRYAEALFQIGEEENKTDNLYNELKEVSSLITTNNDLNNVMKSPLVSKNEKIQKKLFPVPTGPIKSSPTFFRFISVQFSTYCLAISIFWLLPLSFSNFHSQNLLSRSPTDFL